MVRDRYLEDPSEARRRSLVEHARKKLLYHELAEHFEGLVGRNSDAEARAVLSAFRRHGVPRGMFVDLGCGVGRILRRITALAPEFTVTGVDASIDVLNVASRSNSTLVQGDMRNLPLRSKAFDCGACLWSTYNYLSLEDDRTRFFRECARVLQPRGLLLIDSIWRPNGYAASDVRSVDTPVLAGQLTVKKHVQDGINVATYEYDVVDKRTSERHRVLDQEICAMYSASEVVAHSQPFFDVEETRTDSGRAFNEKRQVCLLRVR
jgi:ubiquinone/menaquinone biosynthesis C-methylase UbiE